MRRIVLLTTGILWLFVVIVLPGVWGLGALALILLGLASPSRRKLLTAEQDRVQTLARQELADRLTQFRAVLEQKSSADTVRQALALQQELKLTDGEVGVATLEALRAALEFHEFEDSTANGLPKLAEHVRVTVPDACHFFVDGVVYDKRGDNDPTGALYLTSGRALFLASEGLIAAPWSKVMLVNREGRTIGIQRRDRKTPLLFVLERLADALKAEYVAKRLLDATGQGDPEQRTQREEPAPEPETPIGTTVELVGNGGVFELGVVGESYRQTALKALAAGRRARNEEVFFSAALVPNPTNPHDPNAIKVYIHGGEHVGYLSREDAERYRPLRDALMAQRAAGVCRAKLIGGTPGKPSIGVILDVAEPATEAAAITGDIQPF
jgi:hypothetical protein